uniref:Uncharacterized protein n=1 Tax=Fusarium oxysporum (strain Fo5176) TaxID=660025 RepID=A0A0D2YD33_FUSOF
MANRPAFFASSSSGRAYDSEYGLDCRQKQGFGGYSIAATMMYNVGQPNVASSYFGAETGASAGPSLQQPAQGSSGSANVYQQSNAMDDSSNSMYSVRAMPQTTSTADVSMTDDHDYGEGALEEKWASILMKRTSMLIEFSYGTTLTTLGSD